MARGQQTIDQAERLGKPYSTETINLILPLQSVVRQLVRGSEAKGDSRPGLLKVTLRYKASGKVRDTEVASFKGEIRWGEFQTGRRMERPPVREETGSPYAFDRDANPYEGIGGLPAASANRLRPVLAPSPADTRQRIVPTRLPTRLVFPGPSSTTRAGRSRRAARRKAQAYRL